MLKGFKLISLIIIIAGCVAVVMTADEPFDVFQKRPMKPLTLQGLDGKDVSTAIWALETNGPKVINLFATWCVPCIKEMPVLQELGKHVPIYGIASKEDPEKLKEWLKKYGNPFKQVGIDKGLTFMWDLGVEGLPTTLLLDKTNKIVYIHLGSMTQADIGTIFLPRLEKMKNDSPL